MAFQKISGPSPRRAGNGFEFQKSGPEWLKKLGGFHSIQYLVLRERHTENAYDGEYVDFFPERGAFECAGCGLPLYAAASKIQDPSDDGWPTFDKVLCSKARGSHVGVEMETDGRRLEIICKGCGGHLGHVTYDGEH